MSQILLIQILRMSQILRATVVHCNTTDFAFCPATPVNIDCCTTIVSHKIPLYSFMSLIPYAKNRILYKLLPYCTVLCTGSKLLILYSENGKTVQLYIEMTKSQVKSVRYTPTF